MGYYGHLPTRNQHQQKHRGLTVRYVKEGTIKKQGSNFCSPIFSLPPQSPTARVLGMAPPSNTQESSPSISGSSHTLSWAIIAGLVGGVIAGEGLFHYFNVAVPASILDTAAFIGNTLFINLLKMVLIPLVASSVVVAICSIGSPAQLGRLGVIAFLFYISTMLIAATIGVLLVVSIAPGTGVGESLLSTAHSSSITAVVNSMSSSNNSTGLWMALQNITQHLIPTNPFAAAVNGDLLSVISVSIILGTTLIFVGDVGSPLRSLFNSLFAVCMLAISWILYLAPIGIFFLVTWTIGRIGIASLVGPLSKYIATVTLGLGLHALFVLPTILFLVTRINPF